MIMRALEMGVTYQEVWLTKRIWGQADGVVLRQCHATGPRVGAANYCCDNCRFRVVVVVHLVATFDVGAVVGARSSFIKYYFCYQVFGTHRRKDLHQIGDHWC